MDSVSRVIWDSNAGIRTGSGRDDRDVLDELDLDGVCLTPDGFLVGPPAGVTARTVAIDVNAYSRMKCPCCGRRGFAVTPTTGDKGRYVCRCRCAHCPYQEDN